MLIGETTCTPSRRPLAGFGREDSAGHLFSFCQDGQDNDLDGLTDCDDDDCGAFLVCSGPPTPDAVAADAHVADATEDALPAEECSNDEQCDIGHGRLCDDGRCRVPDDYTVPPPPSAYPVMGMVIDAALVQAPAVAGEVIGDLCGVDAREHGDDSEGFISRSIYGYGYQSTELAYRYLCQFATQLESPGQDVLPFACALGLGGADGGRLRADAWFDATADPTLGLLDRYESGGPEPPRPGDIIVWEVAPAGHVALVRRVLLNDRHGLVEVLEQGMVAATHRYRVDVSADATYAIAGARGWLRAPGHPVGCGLTGAFDLVDVVAAGGKTLLVAEAHVDADPPADIGRVSLVDDDRRVRLTREFPGGPKTMSMGVSVDIEDLVADPVAHTHTLNLEAELLGTTPPVTVLLDTAPFVVTGAVGERPFRAEIEAAASEYGVPVCLLDAITAAASGGRQDVRSNAGAVGMMQIAADDVATAAAMVGVDAALLAEDSDAGRVANLRGAAALLASWARGDGGARIPVAAPEAAVESWWGAVARLGGAGADGDVTTSGFVYRVYGALARGVPGRVSRLPRLDVAALAPAVELRAATALELALGDVLPGDATLEPTTPPLYLRRFAAPALTALPALHRCDGVCTTASCAEVECAAQASRDCVGGEVVWRDACGGLGATVASCDVATDVCELGLCAGARCVGVLAPDGTDCDDGEVCSEGSCSSPNDRDGDGYFVDQAPFDCPGHDDDYYIHPGHPEVLDVRDNDCDGRADDVGYLRLERYRKVWGPNDWEHRYSATPITLPGWVHEDRWIGIYPPNLCDAGVESAPLDGCSYRNAGAEIALGSEADPAFILIALSQCTGVFPSTGTHISLLLQEDSGEYADYVQSPYFTCTRLGYLPGGAAEAVMPGLKYTYRHRASFSDGVSDNMWSVISGEDDPRYDVHTLGFAVLDGG